MYYSKKYKARFYSSRGRYKPKMIVIHATGGSFQGDIITLRGLTDRKVSCHYYISKYGEIFNLLDEEKNAFHAGISKWRGLEVYQIGKGYSVNLQSIGIELENNGHEEYTDIQMKNLIFLIKDIQTRYEIGKDYIVGHSDVAPQRKIDPYTYFDWLKLKQGVFGYDSPEWALESIEFCKKNKILTKIEGETIKDYRLAVIFHKFYDFISK